MADDATSAGSEAQQLRERYRKQLRDSIGGWTGTVITALPTVVFVIVVSLTSLRPALIAAIATAAGLALYRLVRKQPVQQALSGLFGVLIAALIAARTGQARGYFLLGIWSSFLYAVPFGISVLVRRPLVGLLWEFLDPAPPDPAAPSTPWYRRRPLLVAYTVATLIGTALFLSRGVVQLTLYRHDATGWLAFARVAMGYPLYIVAVAAGYWVVRRARRRLPVAEPADVPVADAPAGSADDGAADRRLGFG